MRIPYNFDSILSYMFALYQVNLIVGLPIPYLPLSFSLKDLLTSSQLMHPSITTPSLKFKMWIGRWSGKWRWVENSFFNSSYVFGNIHLTLSKSSLNTPFWTIGWFSVSPLMPPSITAPPLQFKMWIGIWEVGNEGD